MEIAIIAPTKYMKEFNKQGHLEMALAHLCDFKSKYYKYFKQQVKENVFVILDNGLYECKKSIPVEHLIKIAKDLKPAEVVAPDVLFDGKATIANARYFAKLMKRAKLNIDMRIMVVIQGKNQREWLKCYKEACELDEDCMWTIGLSKLSIPRCFGKKTDKAPVAQSRLRLLEKLNSKDDWSYGCQYHLLGGDNWLAHELKTIVEKDYPVRSNDSSVAVNYGHNDLTFNSHGKIRRYIHGNLPFDQSIESTKFASINANIGKLLSITDY